MRDRYWALRASAEYAGGRRGDRSAAMPPRRYRAGNSGRRLWQCLRSCLDRPSNWVGTAITSAVGIPLCVSLGSTRVLMLSRSERNPQGLGGASGALGSYLMDHVLVSAEGIGPALPSGRASGRCLYLPRFDARASSPPVPGRGYGVQVYRYPGNGGRSHFFAFSFAEMLPRPENRIMIDPKRCDAWGIPCCASTVPIVT